MQNIVLLDSLKNPKKRLTDGHYLKEKSAPMRLDWRNSGQAAAEDLARLHTMLSDCLSKGESTSNSQSNKLKSEGGCDAVVQAAGSQELNVSGIEVFKRG